MASVKRVYRSLYEKWGRQGWWPVRPPRGKKAVYEQGRHPRQLSEKQRGEIIIGAILAQNTAWNNAEKALGNLAAAGMLGVGEIAAANEKTIASLIKPSGYYNQKAKRLKTLAAFLEKNEKFAKKRVEKERVESARARLLQLNGIGPETADSILLYAWGKRSFVVDAYTRRIFGRVGLLPQECTYDECKQLVECEGLKIMDFAEFHALLVRLAKENCAKNKPRCASCPLRRACKHAAIELHRDPPHFH